MLKPYRIKLYAPKNKNDDTDAFEIHDTRLGRNSYVGRVIENDLAHKIVDLLNKDFTHDTLTKEEKRTADLKRLYPPLKVP